MSAEQQLVDSQTEERTTLQPVDVHSTSEGEELPLVHQHPLFTFNTRERKLLAKDLSVHLTPRESQLMETLMLEPNKVLPKNDLAKSIIRSDYICDSDRDNMRGLVARLRKKLIEDLKLDSEVIITAWGRGYMLLDHSKK